MPMSSGFDLRIQSVPLFPPIHTIPVMATTGTYECALYNHLLAIMAPDTGAMTCFMPMRGQFRRCA